MSQTEGFPAGCRPNEFGELESQVFVVEPDDSAGATVRAWLCVPPGAVQPLVMLEAEERFSRNRRALQPELVREMVKELATLRRLRTTDPEPGLGGDHPGWCARLEMAGYPHRSRELVASVPRDGEAVWARLVHSKHDQASHPVTYIDIDTIDQILAWPALTSGQHDALIGRLTLLLDLMRLGELPPAGTPIEVRGPHRTA